MLCTCCTRFNKFSMHRLSFASSIGSLRHVNLSSSVSRNILQGVREMERPHMRVHTSLLYNVERTSYLLACLPQRVNIFYAVDRGKDMFHQSQRQFCEGLQHPWLIAWFSYSLGTPIPACSSHSCWHAADCECSTTGLQSD
jgi:hypothetical protein